MGLVCVLRTLSSGKPESKRSRTGWGLESKILLSPSLAPDPLLWIAFIIMPQGFWFQDRDNDAA